MKAIDNSEFDKNGVLNQCFDCLVSLGSENTTMRKPYVFPDIDELNTYIESSMRSEQNG